MRATSAWISAGTAPSFASRSGSGTCSRISSRVATDEYGERPLTGEEVRWGIENLNLTQEKIDALGLSGLLSPIALSCKDHEGGGQVRIQQWDGEKWSFVSDWIEPNRDGFLRDMYEASAAQYAAEKGLTPRSCDG